MSRQKATQEMQGSSYRSIVDNYYQMKSCIVVEIGQATTSGRGIQGKLLLLLGDCFMTSYPFGQKHQSRF